MGVRRGIRWGIRFGSQTDPKTDRQTDPKRNKNASISRETWVRGSAGGPVWGNPSGWGICWRDPLRGPFWIRSGTQFVFGSVSGSSPGESAFWDGFWSPSPTTTLRLPLPFTNRNPQHEPRDSKTHLQTDPKTHSQTNPKTHFKRIQRDPKCIPKRIQIGSPNGSETNI